VAVFDRYYACGQLNARKSPVSNTGMAEGSTHTIAADVLF